MSSVLNVTSSIFWIARVRERTNGSLRRETPGTGSSETSDIADQQRPADDVSLTWRPLGRASPSGIKGNRMKLARDENAVRHKVFPRDAAEWLSHS